MDFFEAQDRARRRTKWLVVLFLLAVGGTIAAGYAVTLALLRYAPQDGDGGPLISRVGAGWWHPDVFLAVTTGTLAVVGLASLFKWLQLRSGGSAVAERIGGRRVNPSTTDLRERRLLNVVEEMAIASGIPMPAVYVLDEEPGLNAFAAGLTTRDAAVAVTRGTLDKLTRDELQGVIGHEFSHILNGDMRLNVHLTAIIFGILVIGLIGRGILRGLLYGRVRGGGGKNKGGGILAIIAVGVAMFLIGYVAYFFGRLIQAAVSRQREFLADASAVQFTRNPSGVTGALKKIGGYALGGTIANNHAGEFGHFFFAQAFKSGFSGLWSTHPPVEERIRAVEPQWDGQLFAPPEVVDVAQESFVTAGFAGPSSRRPAGAIPPPLPPAAGNEPPPLPSRRIPFQPRQVVADIGELTAAHFARAHQLLESLPAGLRDAARTVNSAQALVFGILLNGDRSTRDAQAALVARHAGPEVAHELQALRPSLSILEPTARLPLLQIALPALRQLDPAALDRFATTLDELVHADTQVSPFEFALQKIVLSQLRGPVRAVDYDSFSAVRGEIAIVLSLLAHLTPTDSAAAFAAGIAQLPMLRGQVALLPAESCGLEQLDAALDKLAVASLPIKKRLLVASAHVIGQDGEITVDEGEIFRALAATLDVPMPNLGVAA